MFEFLRSFLPYFTNVTTPKIAKSPTPKREIHFNGQQVNAQHFEPIIEGLKKKHASNDGTITTNYQSNAFHNNEQPKAIIFLDIDGICWVDTRCGPALKFHQMDGDVTLKAYLENHIDYIKKEYHIGRRTFIAVACWEPENMERLRKLCAEFDAKIVVTSTWRNNTRYEHLKNIFALWGLDVIGKTRDDFDHETQSSRPDRAQQIMDFQSEFALQDVPFVVLDDQHEEILMPAFKEKFIFCQSTVAFDEASYKKAKDSLVQQCTTKAVIANELTSESSESYAEDTGLISKTKKPNFGCSIQ